jgi:hypothetical protein
MTKESYSKEYWLVKKFGKLSLVNNNLPDKLSPHSHKKFLFKCECGTEKIIIFKDVIEGKSKSCRQCTSKTKEYWLNKNFSDWILIDLNLPPLIAPSTNTKYLFKCKCGIEKKICFSTAVKGLSVSCGECSRMSKQYWLSKKFGKLQLLDKDLPDFIMPREELKYLFRCDCGKEKYIRFADVADNKSQSCGCGWIFPRPTSKASKNVYNILKTYLPKLKFSVRGILVRKELDIYDPMSKVAIEYNGILWHSSKFKNGRMQKDFEKYNQLKELGIKYIGIFSDEWIHHKDIFLNLILNACGSFKNSKRIYNFEIKEVSQEEFQEVHDKFHYLSGRKVYATKYLLAYYRDQVIGGWSFKKSLNGILDWNRAFWDHNFKAWNPHSKALTWAKENIPDVVSIVTFSDNRLFDGSMYQKLGFGKVKELPPDYEYTDSFKRVHKFNFRVKAGMDEELEAQKKGFYRIYDCGKTKWELK